MKVLLSATRVCGLILKLVLPHLGESNFPKKNLNPCVFKLTVENTVVININMRVY